jgi:hypothetical protein
MVLVRGEMYEYKYINLRILVHIPLPHWKRGLRSCWQSWPLEMIVIRCCSQTIISTITPLSLRISGRTLNFSPFISAYWIASILLLT